MITGWAQIAVELNVPTELCRIDFRLNSSSSLCERIGSSVIVAGMLLSDHVTMSRYAEILALERYKLRIDERVGHATDTEISI